MVVRLRDNLILGNARDSRATPVQLGLSASRRNELYVKIIQSGKSPGYPRYCRAGFRISGEHRLPACKFRQLAETEDSIDLRARRCIAGKLPASAGPQPALPAAGAEKIRDREDALANTRDACATRSQFAVTIILIRPRFAAKWRARIRD